MTDDVIIEDRKLEPFLVHDTFADKTRALLACQTEEWDLLKKGILSLEEVKVKTFDFGGFQVNVQFNPGRFVSTSAKVDEKSINNRKCFLCPGNLPADQKGILYKDNYLVLCNPYPIFHEHFTIPNVNHIPQSIENSFPDLLNLSKDLGTYYTVFYNGPKCGASAPDHLHFQAGEKDFMPLDREYETIKTKLGSKIFEDESLEVYAVDKYLRRFISLESKDKNILTKAFYNILDILGELLPSGDEPMVNVLVTYTHDKWRVIIFPREKHRPSFYFFEGDDNILLSPGSVDMGGVLITPLEKDFDKITRQNIIDIFDEVTISEENFTHLVERSKASL